ncbi:MAG: AAA family ATPase [Aeromicrobium sp.]|uniref:AAA family ATPase n=1 Tax=Aeromicrobium sp. TaxID=1871063 RepID=UPI00262E1A46|nr:AAA family ATPase [Aeromicrobium sp.]MDF1704930.1 AAA family ATPase [Aeromicrobium sp.]
MRYLYERLGDKRFQSLCAALVVSQMDDVEVFPVGQADGGRDITAGKRGVVLQVKFSKDRVKKPVTWLNDSITAEADNIRALVANGCKHYILVTNVEGSSTPDTGDRDRLQKELDNHGKKFGVPMAAMWCSDVDAWVDLAGPGLKLSYVDMLAGSDALVAILQSTDLQENEKRERDFLLDYVGWAWDKDRKVKFSQIEFRSNLLSELFVDVTATRTAAPRQASKLLEQTQVGGLAKHLLRRGSPPFTVLEGVPGQGKSTAAQYICQSFRAQFIGIEALEARSESYPSHAAEEMRLPFRIDLADYALWVSGFDPFDPERSPSPAKAKPRRKADLEEFLAQHVSSANIDYAVDAGTIRDLLNRFATQIVLDGLDEVANLDVRERVVEEIDSFISRRTTARLDNMHVLVTTRPNSSQAPEPSPDRFQHLRLNPLEPDLRKRYLRQWAFVQEFDPATTRLLERTFDDRTSAPHVAQLAKNPMQLALLLHLIRTKGDSLPTERTALYRQYMDLFLDREVEKSTAISPLVKAYRDDIEEASAYIGWYMQGRAEIDSASTRLTESHLVREMKSYLGGVGREAPVQAVFEAMRDRVWVLTSKQPGTYEFDVQPIREFVTARYLHDYAESMDGRSVPRTEILTAMLERSYWLNTARFLAGHFPESQLSDLADDIMDVVAIDAPSRQIRTALWTLLADGVFKKRPRPQERLAKQLADDVTAALLDDDSSNRETLVPEFGGKHLSQELLRLIVRDYKSTANPRRARLAASVSLRSDRASWWLSTSRAIRSEDEETWLRLGYELGVGDALPPDIAEQLTLDTAAGQWLLASGTDLNHHGKADRQLFEMTLAGACTRSDAAGKTEAADLLTVFGPHVFQRMGRGDTIGSTSTRTAAIRRLREHHPEIESALRAMRLSKNSKGTTSRWANTATELARLYGGVNWLFTEIAATALCLDPHEYRTGADIDPKRDTFGPTMHYGNWLSGIRTNSHDKTWWANQYAKCVDDHSVAAWALGLLLGASPAALDSCTDSLDEAIQRLGPTQRLALLQTSARLGEYRCQKVELGPLADAIAPATALALAHHAKFPDDVLGADLGRYAELGNIQPAIATVEASATRRASHSGSIADLQVVMRFETTGGATPHSGTHPQDSLRFVMSQADQFPSSWVSSCERHLDTGQPTLPLRTLAESVWNLA